MRTISYHALANESGELTPYLAQGLAEALDL
jgi:hypothetical protein